MIFAKQQTYHIFHLCVLFFLVRLCTIANSHSSRQSLVQIYWWIIWFQTEGEEDPLTKKKSNHVQRKLDARKASGKLEQHLEEQFNTGRLYGKSELIKCLYWDGYIINFID